MKILDPSQSYTFSKIFELKIQPKFLASEFGYTFARKKLNLPQYSGELNRLEDLRDRIESVLPYVSLANETARREILVSPVILDLIYYTKAELQIEFSVKVTDQLQGQLDYFLENNNSLIVIEAKKDDLDYGLTQLMAELIAIDQWQITKPSNTILGAVTIGNLWQFAHLDRNNKSINQGLETYRVPEDLDPLMRILVQALIG